MKLKMTAVLVLTVGGLAVTPLQAQDRGTAAPTNRNRVVRSPSSYPMIPVAYLRQREAIARGFARFPQVDQERVMELMRTLFAPEMAQFRNMALQKTDEAVDYLCVLIQQASDLLELKNVDRKRFEKLLTQRQLERQAEELALKIREETVEDRDASLEELRRLLEEAFEIKQENMRADVEAMAHDLEELKAFIEKRQGSREAIITHYMKELTGETVYMDW